ncbi:MAG: PAS domain-containing protein [Bacillota bacterium]
MKRLKAKQDGSRGPDWLMGGGETGDLIRSMNWSRTPLGPRDTWPQSLRTAVNMVVANSFPMAILWGKDLIFIYNDAYRVIAGQKHPHAIGRPTREVWPEVWEFNQPIFEKVVQRGETVHMEDQLFRIARHGRMEDAYFTLSYSPVRTEDGQVGGTLVTLMETTRQAESQRQNTSLLEAISDSTGDVIFAKDRQGRMTYANPAALALIGKPLDQVLGRTDAQFLEDKAVARHVMGNDRRIMDRGQPEELEEVVPLPDGSHRVWWSRKTPYRDAAGEVVGLLGVSRDITERKRGEEALHAAHSRLKAMFEHSAVGLVLFDAQPPYRVLAVNRYYEQLWPEPWRSRGLVGQALTEFAPGLEEAGIAEVFRKVVETHEGTFIPNTPYDHMVGGRRWWNWTLEPVIQDGRVVALAHLAVEMTAEVNGRELLQGIIEHIPVLLCLWDPQLRSFRFNKHLRDTLGWTEADAAEGDFMAKVYPDPAYRQEVIAYMQSLQPGFRDLRTTAKDGTAIDVSWANIALPDGRTVGIGVDVRQRKQVEREQELTKVRAERQRFLDMLDTLPVIVDIIRPDGRIEWANRAYRDALGDNTGKLCYASQFGRDTYCDECQAFTPLKTGKPHNWEWTLPNGRTFEIHNFPFAAADGSPAVLEMDLDITERRRAEAVLRDTNAALEKRVAERTAALQESEAKARARAEELAAVMEAVPAITFLAHDPDCQRMTSSHATRQLLRLPERANVSMSASNAQRSANFRPMKDGRELRPEELPVQRAAATGREVRDYELTIAFDDGISRDIFGHAVPLFDESGKVRGAVGAFVDITDRKRAEAELAEAKSLMEMLLAQAPIGFCYFDRDLRYVLINDRLAEINGIPAADHVGRTVGEIVPSLLPATRAVTEQILSTGQPVRQHEFSGETAMLPGVKRYWSESWYPVRNASNDIIGFGAVVEEITDRKRAEDELKKLNRALRALSNSNQAVMRASDEASFVREVCQIIVRDCEHRMAWVGYAREDEEKMVEPVAWAGAGSDYVQTTHITWANTERGRGPSGTCIRTGKPYVCNNFATDPRFAPWRDEAAKRGYASSISLPLLAEGKAFGALMIYSEQPAPFSAEEVRLLAELANDLAHGIVTLRLRAAHAHAAEDLAKAKEAAESANHAKDQFIAVLSHELRTPLTPAVAAVALLRRDVRLPHDVREDLEMVANNIDLEVRLIADLLDVSRIISGKLHLEKRPINVAEAIREAARIVSGDLDAKGQTLEIETPGEPYLISGDAARLQQVFWNLLRNSIKFSPTRSRIAVRARLEPRDNCPLAAQPCPVGLGDCPLPEVGDGKGQSCEGNLVIEVIDHGSGIAPEMLPRLFNAFQQEERSRSFGGLGLGLSICKAVVEMHGGSISAHSDGPGCGAIFTVHLPVAQCPMSPSARRAAFRKEDAASSVPQDGNHPLRILLVEDHADTAKLMSRLLMAEGHEVTTAGTVAEGLAAVRKQKPDVLISDLGLPDGSGLDLMRQLVTEGRRIPAVALSGFGTAADIEKSKAAGFAEHLVKPLSSVDALTSAIAKLGKG